MNVDRLNLTIANDLPELARVAETVEDFCASHDVPAKAVFQINLAVDELLTNTISYGYPNGGRHDITLDLSLHGAEIVIDLIDDALAFNPLDAPPPDLDSPLEDRRIGGLGVHLVKTIMDEVSYRREGDRNHLTLRKRFGAES